MLTQGRGRGSRVPKISFFLTWSYFPARLALLMMAASVSAKYLKRMFCSSTWKRNRSGYYVIHVHIFDLMINLELSIP